MSRQLARALLAVVAVGAMGGLVAGCGDDDATATGTPSTASSAQAASTSAGTSAAVTTSPGQAATAPPETPQPVPSDFPGGTQTTTANAKDDALVAELAANGVTPSRDVAIVVASYICRAIQDGGAQEEMNTFVVAYVGNDPGSTQLSPEDAAKVYIDAAKKTYC